MNSQIIQNRMVAFFDIQGFKDFLQKNGTERTYLAYKREIYNELEIWVNWPVNPIGMSIEIKTIRDMVGFYWFSDSIILFSKEDRKEYLGTILAVSAKFLGSVNFSKDYWLRCGVSYGPMAADPDGILIGEAIVEAYEMEKRQNWFGGALAESATKKVDEIGITDRNIYNSLVINYPIPMKSGFITPKYALDWSKLVVVGSRPSRPNSDDPDVQTKYDNTRKFYTEVMANYKNYRL